MHLHNRQGVLWQGADLCPGLPSGRACSPHRSLADEPPPTVSPIWQTVTACCHRKQKLLLCVAVCVPVRHRDPVTKALLDAEEAAQQRALEALLDQDAAEVSGLKLIRF